MKTEGLTRYLMICIYLSGMYVDYADGATGKYECSSPTSKSVCLPSNYSTYELPNPAGINPIQIEILIEEVLKIDDTDSSITFSCYFNINWPDKRIILKDDFGAEKLKNFPPNTNKTMNRNIIVQLPVDMTKDLWFPKVMIYNMKSYKALNVLRKLDGLWIRADYVVSYSEAAHITSICTMDYDKFPLDTQRCKFFVGSFYRNDSMMTFKIVTAKYNNKESNSIALDYEIEINKLSERESLIMHKGLGNFSRAGFELKLRRYKSAYIMTYYIPSAICVILSWISFLIPMGKITGKTVLLAFLLLILVNILSRATTNRPKAKCLTAIETWMLACLLFVFGALIE